MTVLLVDDDRAVRTVAKACLERAGYTVLTASDGEEGLSVFRRYRDRVELLITDVAMPKLDGLKLAAAALVVRPHLPVLFISGDPPNAERAYACLAKPFTPGHLVKRVQQALTTKRMAEVSFPEDTN